MPENAHYLSLLPVVTPVTTHMQSGAFVTFPFHGMQYTINSQKFHLNLLEQLQLFQHS